MKVKRMAGAFVAGLAVSLLPYGMQAGAWEDTDRRWIELTERLNVEHGAGRALGPSAGQSAEKRWAALRDRLRAESAERAHASRIERAQLGRALRNAAKFGQPEVAMSLIEAGADVNAADRHGTTPLYLAARYGHAGVASLLIERGADVNARTNEGSSAVVIASVYGHDDVVRVLAGLEKRAAGGARSHH